MVAFDPPGHRVELSDLLAAFGGPGAGALPDCYVEGSQAGDWRRLLDALGRTGWVLRWNSDGPPVHIDTVTSRIHDDGSFGVFPMAEVQVNFFSGDEVAFDFDLRELTTQAATDALCEVIELVATALGGDVRVFEEGDTSDEVLRFSTTDRGSRSDGRLRADHPSDHPTSPSGFRICCVVTVYPLEEYSPIAGALLPNTLSSSASTPAASVACSTAESNARPRPEPRRSSTISKA